MLKITAKLSTEIYDLGLYELVEGIAPIVTKRAKKKILLDTITGISSKISVSSRSLLFQRPQDKMIVPDTLFSNIHTCSENM